MSKENNCNTKSGAERSASIEADSYYTAKCITPSAAYAHATLRSPEIRSALVRLGYRGRYSLHAGFAAWGHFDPILQEEQVYLVLHDPVVRFPRLLCRALASVVAPYSGVLFTQKKGYDILRAKNYDNVWKPWRDNEKHDDEEHDVAAMVHERGFHKYNITKCCYIEIHLSPLEILPSPLPQPSTARLSTLAGLSSASTVTPDTPQRSQGSKFPVQPSASPQAYALQRTLLYWSVYSAIPDTTLFLTGYHPIWSKPPSNLVGGSRIYYYKRSPRWPYRHGSRVVHTPMGSQWAVHDRAVAEGVVYADNPQGTWRKAAHRYYDGRAWAWTPLPGVMADAPPCGPLHEGLYSDVANQVAPSTSIVVPDRDDDRSSEFKTRLIQPLPTLHTQIDMLWGLDYADRLEDEWLNEGTTATSSLARSLIERRERGEKLPAFLNFMHRMEIVVDLEGLAAVGDSWTVESSEFGTPYRGRSSTGEEIREPLHLVPGSIPEEKSGVVGTTFEVPVQHALEGYIKRPHILGHPGKP
ncbi:hypothetical protein DXG03_000638 [Asterophora parasitica]|uniref:Uncharacterized protein n=1 Tax=Asterophora parasitica TaxID=117018 RepID=A0A9P7GAA1_9AGAR|nr:hypothetical protein DXG03_000638 [Asterophora parasitica]